jgi:hypothetical protein
MGFAATPDGMLYVFGGYDVEVNYAGNIWVGPTTLKLTFCRWLQNFQYHKSTYVNMDRYEGCTVGMENYFVTVRVGYTE